MEKLLLFALMIAVIWRVFRRYGKVAANARPPSVEDMVRCVHCGVHLPRSEGYVSNGEFFCSEEHLRLRR